MPLKSRLPRIAASLKPRVDSSLRLGAEAVAQTARDRAPRASGALAEAIHTETDEQGTWVVAGDDGVFYGHLVEHGTSKSAPQPFLIPALEERREEILAAVAASLKGGM